MESGLNETETRTQHEGYPRLEDEARTCLDQHRVTRGCAPVFCRSAPCGLKPLGAVTLPSISFQGPLGIRIGAAGMSKDGSLGAMATMHSIRRDGACAF